MIDIRIAAIGGNPEATAKVPKIMAKGVVPTTRGKMSRAPAREIGTFESMRGGYQIIEWPHKRL